MYTYRVDIRCTFTELIITSVQLNLNKCHLYKDAIFINSYTTEFTTIKQGQLTACFVRYNRHIVEIDKG